jgi:hypothetical protein
MKQVINQPYLQQTENITRVDRDVIATSQTV